MKHLLTFLVYLPAIIISLPLIVLLLQYKAIKRGTLTIVNYIEYYFSK